MILHYKRQNKSLVDLLNEIEAFEDKMANFIERYPTYSYDLSLNKDQKSDIWISELKIVKDEHTTIKDT